MNTVQSRMNSAIDDLVYHFAILRGQPYYRKAGPRAPNGILCSIRLDNIIPTGIMSVNHITDAIHECLRGIHSEWHMWSIRVVVHEGHRYFALFFEDACIEDLMSSIMEINGFDLDENESAAVDFVEHVDMLMGERNYFESLGKHAPVYPQLFKAYMGKGTMRTWRNHREFYTRGILLSNKPAK